MAEIHINVGLVALSRGFITLDAFAQAIASLAQTRSLSVRDLWVAPGRLNEGQLATVLDAMGPKQTMLFGAEQPGREQPAPATSEAAVGTTSIRGMGPVDRGAVPGRRRSGQAATAPTATSLVPPMPAQSPPAPQAPAPHIGADQTIPPPFGSVPTLEMVAGRYKRLSLLGAGGLGEVVACEDQVLGRTVALKAGHQKGGVDQYSAKVILAREAKIISCLEHPNIIPIYDAGNDPLRGPFYVMRQVTDTSLEAIFRKRHEGEGDPRDYSLNRLLRYFLQVCNAVDYAHHRGIIHCDIKPANVLLGDYGEVLLVDWGLAQSRNHPLGVRGGTLGYMALEQMDPRIERIDERADVFALGAILFEILAGKPAFPDAKNSAITSMGTDPRSIYKTPLMPTMLSPGVEIPPEIEDICMRAIAIDRKDRLANARLLADAIDDLIEGSKQRERRRIEADKSADDGDDLAERYHEFAESRPEKLIVFRALRADVVPWAALEEKHDLWDSEDVIRITDSLQVRTFQSAVSAYERALDAVPDHVRARRGLARLFWSELQRARSRGDTLDQVAYEQLLREVDDGTYVRELQKDGVLQLEIGANAGQVTLAELVEKERRLVDGTVEVIADRPTLHRPLAAGRYVVRATIGEGPASVSWPVSIEPGSSCKITVDPPLVCAIGVDEVLVPGGQARLGGDPLSTETDELVVVDVHSFIIQRWPVTFAQWFEFLDDLGVKNPGLLDAHVPRTAVGMPAWRRGRGQWEVAVLLATGMPSDTHRLPVFGVSAESAEAYARWLSERQGKQWRLPTEVEWEKAGRGTDGRSYPWGDHFDATFCKMRDSRPGLPIAEPVGSFRWDISPYGVRDLAGGVADWCTPDRRRTTPREPREVVSRGGAWCDWAIDCRLASRRRYLATEHSARVGVRLARDL
jgi:serine/threonine protein kinase/formylglycine-generating enzyme required for sulfatase activity